MKKRLAGFLILVLAVAATAFGLTCYLSSRKAEDQWTWLRREFRLSDAQYTRILALHEAYQPICADHCNRIMAMQRRMAELEKSGTKTSEFSVLTALALPISRREALPSRIRLTRAGPAAHWPGERPVRAKQQFRRKRRGFPAKCQKANSSWLAP